MPTIPPRTDGYRFFFFSNERNEPVHVHVEKGEAVAKFWLKPIRQAMNKNFKPPQLRRIAEILNERENEFVKAWNERH